MPAFIIPARSSRHRTACFALYKALLQQVPKVPLPDDVLTIAGRVNPIKHLIRGSFRRNKNDTSPRLVVSALKNGYRFLTFLGQAQTPASPAHAEIVAFLRERLPRVLAVRNMPKKPKENGAPHPGTIPLLTRVAPRTPLRREGEVPADSPPPMLSPLPLPVYVSTLRPRPLSELKGRRRVPVLAADAMGVPFLRLGKPQSPVLSRIVGQKARRRHRRTGLISVYKEKRQVAAEEDAWERSVAALLRAQEGSDPGEQDRGQAQTQRRRWQEREPEEEEQDQEPTYADGVQLTINYLANQQEEETADLIARADALNKIAEAERALAKKEKAERTEQRRKAWEAKQAAAAAAAERNDNATGEGGDKRHIV